jgi:hypothetical protein
MLRHACRRPVTNFSAGGNQNIQTGYQTNQKGKQKGSLLQILFRKLEPATFYPNFRIRHRRQIAMLFPLS